MKYFFCLITMIAVASIVATPAVAFDQPPADKAEAVATATEAQVPVGAGGMMVFIDPETGRVTNKPTAEQRAALQTKMAGLFNQSDEGTYDEILPNGAVLRDLQGRLMNATVVRIAPDGSLHQECSTNPVSTLAAKQPPVSEPDSTAVAAK